METLIASLELYIPVYLFVRALLTTSAGCDGDFDRQLGTIYTCLFFDQVVFQL